MSCRAEILEQALDHLEEAVVVLDARANVLLWNSAATALTGRAKADVLTFPCPADLYHTGEDEPEQTQKSSALGGCEGPQRNELLHPTLVSLAHRQGHAIPAMLRRVTLRDAEENLTGAALVFYPVEESDLLPHGEAGDDVSIERCQADMEVRLDVAQHQWLTKRISYGLLWIAVDQAPLLRRTHGREACESMLRIVEQTLMRQMNPSETIGRWGDDEFLVLAHERTLERLLENAQRLAGHARIADFRWWGDRVALTVSIGAAQAAQEDTLQQLLSRARGAMQTSSALGGNQVTRARGDGCSR